MGDESMIDFINIDKRQQISEIILNPSEIVFNYDQSFYQCPIPEFDKLDYKAGYINLAEMIKILLSSMQKYSPTIPYHDISLGFLKNVLLYIEQSF